MSHSFRLNGGHEDPAGVRIRAGVLSATIENGALRTIRVSDREVVRMVYAAVRDHNWDTISGVLSDIVHEETADGLRCTFTCTHRTGDIHFVWHGEIVGRYAENSLTFSFDGEAKTAFRTNRTGFCVLHPADVAGAACTVTHVNGSEEHTRFPGEIMPHQPFFDVRAIAHEGPCGARITVTMEGDTFETEDQRNWTDASFKTYCTPLALPFPRELAAGARIRQTITIRADVPAGAALGEPADEDAPVVLTPTGRTVPVPALGLCVNSDGAPLSIGEAALLRALRPAHLRVDLFPDAEDFRERYAQAASQARALDAGLLVALHLREETAAASLSRVADWTREYEPPLFAWLVLKANSHGTPAPLVHQARAALAEFHVPVGSGTNGYFTELNRNRPEPDALDFAAYSVNPQVHAFDNTSLVETLPTQGETVRSAAAFTGKPIFVSPVTLKIRWNPNATGDNVLSPDTLPPQVDTRQMSQLGAAWTLGSIRQLAEAGAQAITYYELTGWLGVVERETGSPLPALFPSEPGQPFPLYDVLKAIGEFAGGSVHVLHSSHPLRADGLLLERDGRQRLMLANYRNDYVEVTVPGLTETTLEPYAVVIADGQAHG
jgi:D-apionolactonase